MRRIPTGMRQANDATAALFSLCQEDPWRRIPAGQSLWGEEDDGRTCAQARLLPQAVQGWALETTSPDPVLQQEGFRTQRLRL